MKKIIVVFVIIGWIIMPFRLNAQISQKGKPIHLRGEKSTAGGIKWYKTPGYKIQKSKDDQVKGEQHELHIKPFKFAHSFEVKLNPEKNGNWTIQDNRKIWTLGIESEGAYSINLIFGKYKLPEGAKLFIYNEDRSHVIGAFTSENNKESGKLATQPVAGDKIVVQYEEPLNAEFSGVLEVFKISHDYIGVIEKSSTRRPLGISQECNIDINCEIANEFSGLRNSVCRLYVDGDELCTGVLVNNTSSNTADDVKPYLLTAYHCIENSYKAQVTLFVFNYESPYCGSLDGDVSKTISGSYFKSSFDSLDFSLVELSTAPPKYYQPYYAGFDVTGTPAESSKTIHHPLGDIKKVTFDNDAPVTATFKSGKTYLKDGAWRIVEWDNGLTESGSSGAPLFDQDHRVVGILSGGAQAYCSKTNGDDYFSKISKSWNYRSENTKQLKYWLDPGNTGETQLDGLQPYVEETKCQVFTNFDYADTTQIQKITENISAEGYWSGTNANNYKEFSERFDGFEYGSIQGVSLGIAKLYINDYSTDALVKLKVYDGDEAPEDLLYEENFVMNNLEEEAMNYFEFSQPVATTGKFHVTFSVEALSPQDTLVLYHAKRTSDRNTFYLKDHHGWSDYRTERQIYNGSALLIEALMCGYNEIDTVPVDIKEAKTEIQVYPNPVAVGTRVKIEFPGNTIELPDVKVYDLVGKEIACKFEKKTNTIGELEIRTARAGIYILSIFGDDIKSSAKIYLGMFISNKTY